MSGAQDRSFVSSVVFLEFVEYTKKPVAEQFAIKERFNALLKEALSGVPPADRIVLDASDGAAISFVGDPEDALFVAMRLRDGTATGDAASKIDARIGINIGAVKLVKDSHGQPNIIGDGIDVAQRVMSFAEPGGLLASRAFFELLSVLSQDYLQLFKYEGVRTDHEIREHQVYRVGEAKRDLRGGGRGGNTAERTRKLWLMAGAAAAVILVLAIGVRLSRAKPAPPPEPPPPVEAPAAAQPAPTDPNASKAAKPKAALKAKAAATPAAGAVAPATPTATTASATVHFAITPWGEIYVDGAKKGVSPPVREVQIAPGKHTIEVRNTSFPSYSTQVEVTSGGQANVKYKFQ